MDDRRERNTGRSGRESGSKRKIFRRTVFLMLVCGVGLFIPLIGQLWNIAIVHHEEYQAEAVEQQTRDVEVAAFRGSSTTAAETCCHVSHRLQPDPVSPGTWRPAWTSPNTRMRRAMRT